MKKPLASLTASIGASIMNIHNAPEGLREMDSDMRLVSYRLPPTKVDNMKQATTLNTPTLTRPKQTAEHFQISIMTLHRWRQRDGFPQPLKCGQIVLYDIAAMSEWLTGQGEG